MQTEFEAASAQGQVQDKGLYESSLFALTSLYEQHRFEIEAIHIYEKLISLRPTSALCA